MAESDLPTKDQIQSFCSAATSQLSSHCQFLRYIPSNTLAQDQDFLDQALAALGAALKDDTSRVALWLHANRTLTATLAINNSKLRDFRAYAAVSTDVDRHVIFKG